MRVLILAGALLLAGSPHSALAAPLTEDAKGYISDEVFVAALGAVSKGGETGASMKYCRNAEQKAAQYDRHPYFDAVIANCFGTVEQRTGNKKVACDHYARAIGRLQLLPANDPYYDKSLIDGWRKKRTEFGC